MSKCPLCGKVFNQFEIPSSLSHSDVIDLCWLRHSCSKISLPEILSLSIQLTKREKSRAKEYPILVAKNIKTGVFTGLYLLPLTFGEPVVFKEVKLEPGTEQTLGNITRVTMNKAFEPTQQQAPEET